MFCVKFKNTPFRLFSQRLKAKPPVCYYKLLNLSPEASIGDIKKEFYTLAKKYHPDNNENSSANQIVILF